MKMKIIKLMIWLMSAKVAVIGILWPGECRMPICIPGSNVSIRGAD